MATEPYPIWWRGITAAPPAQWVYVFEVMTGDDTAEEWALAAGIFVAQSRSRTSRGPTFAELFHHLLPDYEGIPAPFPVGLTFLERRRAVTGFRGHAAIEWRRRGMITWEPGVTRSLRVGRVFRERSRNRQRTRISCAAYHRASRPTLEDQGPATTEELPPEVRRILDRVAPGWPRILEVDSGWFPLLARLDARLAFIAPGYVVQQCKSKFGALTFHAQPTGDPYDYNEEFAETIRAAEWESITTCEVCGALDAKQYTIQLWVRTLCDTHAPRS